MLQHIFQWKQNPSFELTMSMKKDVINCNERLSELNRLLNEKVNKIKSILVINNVLKNSFIEENDFSNDISFTTNESLPKTTDILSLLTS